MHGCHMQEGHYATLPDTHSPQHYTSDLLSLALDAASHSMLFAPCSGMLPGYVSGFYSFDECHIDLAQLSRYAGAALVQEEATGIDIKVRRV